MRSRGRSPYAIESAEATRKKKGTCGSPIGAALNNKFADSCALYIKGTRGAPKFKSNARGDSISLQWQIGANTPNPIIGDRVNIAKILGAKEPVLVPVIFHRPIPDGAVIKQVALTLRGERMFVVFMLDMAATRSYVTTGQTLGIDPGRKMALSASTADGLVTHAFAPPIARDKHFLKRLRRLQRKADRQLRVANPECFNADGTFKRGFRPKVKSKNFQETGRRIIRMQEHIANARLDYYHNTANRVLHQNDVIGIGTWRGNGNGLGVGKSKRAQNRKGDRQLAPRHPAKKTTVFGMTDEFRGVACLIDPVEPERLLDGHAVFSRALFNAAWPGIWAPIIKW